MEGKVSIVDSTQRFEWEVEKERKDIFEGWEGVTCGPGYDVQVGSDKTEWNLAIKPKVHTGRENDVIVSLGCLKMSANFCYTVQWGVALKTPSGYWPRDFVEDIYGNKEAGMFSKKTVFNSLNRTSDINLGPTDKIREKFINDKITLVATLVIYVEGKDYLHHREMARNFVTNMRSISDLDMLTDFTVICGEKSFKCHRNILSSMSSVFQTMIVNEMFLENNEYFVKIDDAFPEIVEAMLEFMANGILPEDIDEKAPELIYMADRYDLKDLTKACEVSLFNNITIENVINTLITIDKCVPISENRDKIIDFIKKEATQIVKLKDWVKFVQNYPNLVTEIFLSAVKPKD